jgi:hypothetical protein
MAQILFHLNITVPDELIADETNEDELIDLAIAQMDTDRNTFAEYVVLAEVL